VSATLDLYEERVAVEVIEAAIRERQREVTRQRSIGTGTIVAEIRALEKARDALEARP
jgi:hypothetical protein